MSKSKPKKKHHYIPVFYLKGFTNANGCLCVYDKDATGMFESSPEGIAYEKNYFSFITPEGGKDSETLENHMMAIETASSKVIKKILGKQSLTDDERITFACFIASMMVRTPNFRTNIQKSTGEIIKHTSIFMASHKENFERMIGRYEKNTGNKIGMSLEEFRQWMLNPKNYTVSVDPQYAIAMALSQMEHLTWLFLNMKWTFLEATDEHKFMTGDNPLHYIDPTYRRRSFYGVGLLNENIEVTLPLSKNMCALGTWKRNGGYLQAKNQHVKHVNRMTVMNSVRFLFAHNKSSTIDSFVKKYKGSHPIMKVN